MKRILFGILSSLFIFSAAAQSNDVPSRALFISVVEVPAVLSSRKEIMKLIDFAKQAHIKVLFVQIYHGGQAWFPSKVADASPYEKCRKALGEDPLALIIGQAHAQGIQVHAWLNLLSLGQNTNANFLKKYGTDILTRNLKEKINLRILRSIINIFLSRVTDG